MKPRDDSDEALMRQVGLGKVDALHALLRRHASSLLTFLQRTVGNRHWAEDLLQEVFLAVWVHRRRYRYPLPFRPWLFGIAMNKCRGDLRRQASAPVLLEDCPVACPVADDPAPAEVAVASERATIVAAALGRLSSTQRAVVVMRVWNGLSYAEIAEAIEASEATARSHMFHGLQTLRRYLQPRMK